MFRCLSLASSPLSLANKKVGLLNIFDVGSPCAAVGVERHQLDSRPLPHLRGQRNPVQTRWVEDTKDLKRGEKLGREQRYRTVIFGMEPRRIAEVMLLPRTGME
jgi:hypothetical protein